LHFSEEKVGNEDSEEKDEVHKVLRRINNGNSPGEDRLTAEMFKWEGEKMKDEVAKLFSMCLRNSLKLE